ncbi:MAG: aldehyde dehydrogenase family protein [Gemmatimonadales bacterium]
MAMRLATPYINGRYLTPGTRTVEKITNPYTGRTIGRAAVGTLQDLDQAIRAAGRAFDVMRNQPAHERHDILQRISDGLRRGRERFARLIVADAGKPLTQARGEVDRAIMTFSLAADESRRVGGEVIPLDVDPRGADLAGVVRRFPVGPVSAISPFNFPLNLVAHKLAPAIATGCPVVLKAPPQCPLTAFALAELVASCDLPPGGFNVLHLPVPVAQRLATDERFRLLSFTGSAAVGWHLKAVAGRKKVLLELGGNAAAIVHEDTADLDWTAARLAAGAYAYAGQVCIKVQRIYVHRRIYPRFLRRFVDAAAALKVGDPSQPATVVGPMIDRGSAERVESWVREAVMAGARVRLQRRRRGNLLGPIVLTDAPRASRVVREEVFGPVTVVEPYGTWRQALTRVNDSRYGLQAGVFTRDIDRIREAFDTLEVGGVIVNDYPTLRIDNYPYGGIKDSGLGREGVRYAMEEMTEPRMLVLRSGR